LIHFFKFNFNVLTTKSYVSYKDKRGRKHKKHDDCV
jgi:hypothetical protein